MGLLLLSWWMVVVVSMATAASSSAQWKPRIQGTTAAWPATTGGQMRSHLTCRSKASSHSSTDTTQWHRTMTSVSLRKFTWRGQLYLTLHILFMLPKPDIFSASMQENSVVVQRKRKKNTMVLWVMYYWTYTQLTQYLGLVAEQLLGYITFGLDVFH